MTVPLQNIRFCPAPSRLKLAGNITSASLSEKEVFPPRRKGRRGAAGAGLRYEAKVHEHFLKTYPLAYVAGPWFRYRNEEDKVHYCQPDGLLVNFKTGLVTIVEIKLKHTADAWWQLKKLYEPVLERVFTKDLWALSALEVVRWYDPDTPFPQAHALIKDPLSVGAGKIGVHIWSGRRR